MPGLEEEEGSVVIWQKLNKGGRRSAPSGAKPLHRRLLWDSYILRALHKIFNEMWHRKICFSSSLKCSDLEDQKLQNIVFFSPTANLSLSHLSYALAIMVLLQMWSQRWKTCHMILFFYPAFGDCFNSQKFRWQFGHFLPWSFIDEGRIKPAS